MKMPYGIYDVRQCALIHIGLYENIPECWNIFLGWPTHEEIKEAQFHGLHCIPITCHYQLPKEESKETSK
jgi:hypothetical protein